MKKSVETVLALLLILVLGISLLQLSGASTALYNRLTASKSDRDQVKIAAAYLVTKLKQSDRAGCIAWRDDRIVVSEEDGVTTYIYHEDGRFVESSLYGGLAPTLDNAFVIAEIDALSIEIDGSRIHFRVEKGEASLESTVRLRSGGVE